MARSAADRRLATASPLIVDFWRRPLPAHLVDGPWEAALTAYYGAT